MQAKFSWLHGACSLAVLIAVSTVRAEEPPASESDKTAEEVVEEAAAAAQSIAAEAAAEAQAAAAAIASEAAVQAQAAAEDVANEVAKAAGRAVAKAGVAANFQPGPYQLDVNLAPIPRALASQLKLDGAGVLVDRVEKGGAADKAGILAHDVLISVDGKTITELGDLARAVRESEGNELKLELLRSGEKQTLTVKPRATGKVTANLSLPAVEVDEEIIKLESKIREKLKNAGVDVRLQLIRPGHVMPPDFVIARNGLPEDVTITVRKQGTQPAKIEVARGDEQWAVSEDELEKLPEDLRPEVERMLGRGPFQIRLPGPAPIVAPLPPGGAKAALYGKEFKHFNESVKSAVAQHAKRFEEYSKAVQQAAARQSEIFKTLEHRARDQEQNMKHMNEAIERMSKQLEELQKQAQSEAESKEAGEEKSADE